jgi:2-keto-3-deoxy-L-arabinonate dehydratase
MSTSGVRRYHLNSSSSDFRQPTIEAGMTENSWRGIFPSLPTTFSPTEELDLAAQRSLVRFALDSGSHGLLCFGLAGEVFRLAPHERIELLKAIVEEAAGDVPILAGVGTEDRFGSVRLAQAAADAGADGVVIPPPLTLPGSQSELFRYFETVAGAVDLPVMIQDAPEYLGIELGPSVVAELADRIPNFAVLKLEVAPDQLPEWTEALDGRLTIFCGSGGLHLIDCLERGAVGIAPGTDLIDVLVEIHGHWEAERAAEAWDAMRAVLPMLVFQMQTIDHYNAAAKYVLQRRGIISCAELRAPAYQLNACGRELLDEHLARLNVAVVE